jgi:polar amino acid transport system ATP-binding protein
MFLKKRVLMLKINNASKKFNDIQVLKNIDLSIDENSITGLAGPSGGGKSTLLRSIQGLEKCDSGNIDFAGKSGFMFQDFQLFPHMTVLENLTYAPLVLAVDSKIEEGSQQANQQNKKQDIKEKAKEMLRQLGIIDKMNNYPGQLSGGQKQRVALARSLMMKPDLMLCDEPTSGLDVATIQDVVELLQKVKEMGASLIIASHDLDFLTKIASRIILLKNGSIAADIKTADIENPLDYLKKFY